MRTNASFLALAAVACFLAIGTPSGADPGTAPTPAASPTDSPSVAPSDTSSPSAEPSMSPSPIASPSPSDTPYVRRYFNGRPIDTPPPSPAGSLTPTPIPTTTPYVRRYFNGRLIDTPPPSLTPNPAAPSPSVSLTPTPLPTTTPYVRRYFNGRLIDTPPPSLTPNPAAPSPSVSLTPTPLPTTTPYVRRYFNGRPIDTPSPNGSETPSALPSSRPIATATPHPVQLAPSIRSDALLGNWHCTTFGGTTLAHEFSRADDAVSLYVTTTIVLPNGKQVKLHEVYAHNPNTHMWTAVLAGGLIYAKGADWTGGDTWTLVGQSRENGTPIRFRMVFTDLGTDAYRRDFQRLEGASWATYAGETCLRAQP
jgi:hypothetical protein